jgi:hypothetical protein
MISKAVGMECRACDSHPTQSARNLGISLELHVGGELKKRDFMHAKR